MVLEKSSKGLNLKIARPSQIGMKHNSRYKEKINKLILYFLTFSSQSRSFTLVCSWRNACGCTRYPCPLLVLLHFCAEWDWPGFGVILQFGVWRTLWVLTVAYHSGFSIWTCQPSRIISWYCYRNLMSWLEFYCSWTICFFGFLLVFFTSLMSPYFPS